MLAWTYRALGLTSNEELTSVEEVAYSTVVAKPKIVKQRGHQDRKCLIEPKKTSKKADAAIEKTDEDVAREEANAAERAAVKAAFKRGRRARQRASRSARDKAHEDVSSNSVLKQELIDPLQQSREELLNEVEVRYQGLVKLSADGGDRLNSSVNERLRGLHELHDYLKSEAKSLSRRVPVCEAYKKGSTLTQLREKIIDLEFEGAAQPMITREYNEYTKLFCVENNKAFYEKVHLLADRIKAGNVVLNLNLDQQIAAERRSRAIEKLAKRMTNIDDTKVVCTEFTGASGNKIMKIAGKIEGRFSVSLIATKNGLGVWGYENNVRSAMAWIDGCEFVSSDMLSIPARLVPMIIGKGGAVVSSIEEKTGAVIDVQESAIVTVNGSREQKAAAVAMISDIQKKIENMDGNLEVPVDADLARFIVYEQMQKLHELESKHNAIIKVLITPNTGVPRISVRCNPSVIDQIKRDVDSYLIDKYVVERFHVDKQARGRLFVERNGKLAKEVFTSFELLKNKTGFHVLGNKEDDTLTLVVAAEHAAVIRNELPILLKKAGYVTKEIVVEMHERKALTSAARRDIEAACNCEIATVAKDNKVLVRAEMKDIDAALENIRCYIAHHGKMRVYKLAGSELVKHLLQDRAAELKELERIYSCQITVNSSDIIVVGSDENLDDVINELDDISEEIGETMTKEFIFPCGSQTGSYLKGLKSDPRCCRVSTVLEGEDEIITVVGKRDFIIDIEVFIASNYVESGKAAVIMTPEPQICVVDARQSLNTSDFPSL